MSTLDIIVGIIGICIIAGVFMMIRSIRNDTAERNYRLQEAVERSRIAHNGYIDWSNIND